MIKTRKKSDIEKSGADLFRELPRPIASKITQYLNLEGQSGRLWTSHSSTIEGEAAIVQRSDKLADEAGAARREVTSMAKKAHIPEKTIEKVIDWMRQPQPR